jgi:hypothetical protein
VKSTTKCKITSIWHFSLYSNPKKYEAKGLANRDGMIIGTMVSEFYVHPTLERIPLTNGKYSRNESLDGKCILSP